MSFVPSGDADIDRIRREVSETRTSQANHEERFLNLPTWRYLLQRQGADTTSAAEIIVKYEKAFFEEDMGVICSAIDEEYRFLEGLQIAVAENPPVGFASGEKASDRGTAPKDWPMYAGNPQHTAFTEDAGPVEGNLAWRRPMGLAWYPRPVIEGDKLYVTSPGMRTILYCLNSRDGRVIWKTKKRPTDNGELYSVAIHKTHCAASTPLVLKDTIVINELGGQSRDFAATELLYVSKSDGTMVKRIEAGTQDYRTGYSMITGRDDVLIYPVAAQKIGETPPQIVGTSRIVCKATESGETLWDFYIGPTFAEPVLDEGRVYVGTADGVVFSLNVDIDQSESHVWGTAPRQRVAWQYKAGGATNSAALVHEDRVFLGSNDGSVTCLDKGSGEQVWSSRIAVTEAGAFKLFSTPRIVDGRLYIGAANKHLYCLDTDTGDLIWDHRAEEWIRSAPECIGPKVFFATMDGTVQCLNQDGAKVEPVWTTRVGTHQVLADVVAAEGKLYVTSADLFLWCLDAETGDILWRHSLLESVEKDGERIAADEVAAVAGGHFQSKPTAADGKVFYGTPARFVYGVDYRTGKELWRFEMGAAVSGSPTYSNGRVFVGQQGGEDYFYCLDATDGHMIWKQSLSWVWSSATAVDGKLFVPGVDGYVSCLSEEDGAILWRYRTGMAAHPEPPVDRGRVYFGSWDHYDYSLDVNDGSVVWQHYTGGTPDSGAPIAYEGRLYLPMGGSRFLCMDADSGEVIWEHCIEGVNYNASPALHGGHVLVSTSIQSNFYRPSSHIYCLNAETGEEIWRHPGGGLTAAAIADGKVYFGSTSDPFFYCVDEKGNGDGTTTCLWKYKMGDRVFESVPPVYGGMAYICCRDGYLYAFK